MAAKPRAVLDTNVFVFGLLNPMSTPAVVLRSLRSKRFTLMILLVSCCCMPAMAQRQRSQMEAVSARSGRAGAAVGRQDFESRCSPCHGLDGRGGEHAPNISTNPALLKLTEEEVFRIVRDGIPSQGMPGFDFLAASQISSIVSYLRSLGQRSSPQPLRGDPARGEGLFFGKAKCCSCHISGGKGGFLGSDLTGYGRSQGLDEVRQAILDSARFHDPRKAVLEVVTRRGERFSGAVRNEDNFSLQLLGEDGALHMLMKSEVKHSNWTSSPAMPEDYSKQLSPGELDDLVSYLSRSLAVGHRGTETQSHGGKERQ